MTIERTASKIVKHRDEHMPVTLLCTLRGYYEVYSMTMVPAINFLFVFISHSQAQHSVADEDAAVKLSRADLLTLKRAISGFQKLDKDDKCFIRNS